MTKFIVEVARDATVRYQAVVEAKDLDEVRSNFGKSGYKGETITEWKQVGLSSYDNVEEYAVKDMQQNTLHEESLQ